MRPIQIKRDPISKTTRETVYDKCNGHCAYCGETLQKIWHVDHVIPVASGGIDDELNFMPACSLCNNYKSGYLLEDFRYQLQMNVHRGRTQSVHFRNAERFKQITVHETPIVFYFETLGITFNEQVVREMIKATRFGKE